MTTSKYTLHTTEYSVQGWDTIMSGDMEKLDAAIHTNLTATLGETVAQYKAVYVYTDGKFYKAQADGLKQPCLGLTLQSGIADDEILVQRVGPITNEAWSWTPGLPIYLSMITAGELTQDVPWKNKHIIAIPISATEIILVGGLGDLNFQTLTTTSTTTTTSSSTSSSSSSTSSTASTTSTSMTTTSTSTTTTTAP